MNFYIRSSTCETLLTEGHQWDKLRYEWYLSVRGSNMNNQSSRWAVTSKLTKRRKTEEEKMYWCRSFAHQVYLDSCAGTNPSQFVIGGLGLLCCTGSIDMINLFYMVVGHTKFEPDCVSRANAGRQKAWDTFNHAIKNQHTWSYARVFAYDGSLFH